MSLWKLADNQVLSPRRLEERRGLPRVAELLEMGIGIEGTPWRALHKRGSARRPAGCQSTLAARTGAAARALEPRVT